MGDALRGHRKDTCLALCSSAPALSSYGSTNLPWQRTWFIHAPGERIVKSMRFQPISDSIWIKMTPISCREIKDRPENKEANKRHLFTWHMMITSETKKGYLSMLNVFPPGNLPAGFFSPPNYVFLCSGISLMDSGLRIHS